MVEALGEHGLKEKEIRGDCGADAMHMQWDAVPYVGHQCVECMEQGAPTAPEMHVANASVPAASEQ